MMNLTDTGLPKKLAREILPPGTDPQTLKKLVQQLDWALKNKEIKTERVGIKRTRRSAFDHQYYDFTEYESHATLGHAAIWARDNGFTVRPEILDLLPPDSSQSPPPGSGAKWPWGDYETPLLNLLAEAVQEFCLSGDYPKKETGEVTEWIKQRMKELGFPPSDALADKIETLISPRPYSHHRQRKQR